MRLCLLAALCLLGAACGVNAAVKFEPLGVGRGLDARIATSLLVDRQGFLWAASREGLYRYDGYRAIRFMPDGSPGALTDADIRMLYEGSDGLIWVATNNGGLNAYDPTTGRFSSYRYQSDVATSLSNDSIYGMAETADGRLWVGTQIGLNRLDPASGVAERFLHDPSAPQSISNNYIFAVFRDSTGAVWITTVGGGINRWNEQAAGFDRFDLAAATGGPEQLNDVFAVAETANGSLWFGTRVGLVRLNRPGGTFERIGLPDGAGAGDTITQLVVDAEQHVWMSLLSGGVVVHDPSSGTTWPANPAPLGSDTQLPAVPQIALALTGDLLFVGTWGSGIYSGRLHQADAQLLRAQPETGGLQSSNVTAVRAEEPAGQPWAGTLGGSLERTDFTLSDKPRSQGPARTFNGGVLSMERVTSGLLFVGMTDGLLEWHDDPSLERFHEHDPARAGSLGPGHVTSLEADGDGGLWVGVGGSGLFHLGAGSDTFRAYAHDPADPASISGDYVTSLLQSGANELWVGTRSQGLNRCRVKPWQCERFAPDPGRQDSLGHFHVTSVFQDRQGTVWVTTDGGGLHRVERSASGEVNGFSRWTRRDGLVSDATLAAVQDDDGSIWVSSREGLSRLDPATGRIANYIEEGGLPSAAFNTHSADRDQRFAYFGAVSGLLALPTGTAFQTRDPSPVRLTAIERPSATGAETSMAARPESITIDHGDLLSLDFAVLDFAEVPHEYEYRMDRASDWIRLGTRQEITFFGLAPGRHDIHVRGRDVFGLWSEAQSLSIEVVPPFWMTDWFRLAAVTALLLLILAAHQARINVLHRRNRELQSLQVARESALEQARQSQAQLEEAFAGMRSLAARLDSAKEEERQTLSRELHDELGQVLTATKLNLQLALNSPDGQAAAKRLQDSVEMVDQMIRQVRNISLSLRPPLLDEAGLVPALEYYLAALQKRSGMPIELTVGSDVSGTRPDVKTAVFRIVQEAVNNALKYASAGRIRVTLDGSGNDILVTVQDDGRGFDRAAILDRIRSGEHLGLLGMYERVRGAGGTFELDASPGNGCTIRATVPR